MDIIKSKRQAEKSLQQFGQGLRKLAKKRTPEQRLKGGMKAYYESGGGGRVPKLSDYK